MKEETKVQSKKVVFEEDPNHREPPAYSHVFLSAMEDYAYETLRQHLQAQGIDQDAVALLDTMRTLNSVRLIYHQEKTVLYVWNNEASECIASISQIVPHLGGHFLTPSGEVLK